MPDRLPDRSDSELAELNDVRRRLCAAVLDEAAPLGLDHAEARLVLEWSGHGDSGCLEKAYFQRRSGGDGPAGPWADLGSIDLSETTACMADDFLTRLVCHFPETEGLEMHDGGGLRAALDLRDGTCEATAGFGLCEWDVAAIDAIEFDGRLPPDPEIAAAFRRAERAKPGREGPRPPGVAT